MIVQFTLINSLSVYRKRTKIKKLTVLVHYIIFPSLIQTIHFLYMCGLTFFRRSCPLQVHHPLHWTIKVERSRYPRSSLTRYRLPDSQESPVWKSNSNRRKACRGQRYINISISHSWLSISLFLLSTVYKKCTSFAHIQI